MPRLVSLTLAFALQLRKKHGKTSVRVVKECCYPLPKHPHNYNTHHTHTHNISKSPTQPYSTKPTIHTPTIFQKAPHIHTVQNPPYTHPKYFKKPHTSIQYKTHTYTHPKYFKKPPHIHTVQNPHIHTPIHFRVYILHLRIKSK